MSAYESAKKQISNVSNLLEKKWINKQFLKEFIYPDRVIKINIPVKMDNWELKVFKGYRSQHKNYRWPYKWWIRFHQNVTLDEVKALSIWMTIKVGVVDLPLWWGKWGIIVNPKELSENELEQLSRWYVRQLYRYLGPDFDVPAPDVNTNSKIMAWMVDEYSHLVGKFTPGAFTGKPLSLWGSKWRNIATSLGWLYVLQTYLSKKNLSLKWKKIAIQWAGNAGLNFAKLAEKEWAIIIAISDSKGWIYNPNWLNIDKIEKIKINKKSVIELENTEKISNKEILELKADILVLAALENQITLENAQNIKAPIILELANWPINPEAENILFSSGITIIPDILANAGWVTVSYFEQVQWNMNYYWSEDEVYNRLKTIMVKSTEQVIKTAQELNIDFRKSSYLISLERQYEAWKFRKR